MVHHVNQDIRWIQRGFTLFELLVVVAVIALLMSMLLPVIGSVRDASRGAGCSSNMRTIFMGLHTYGLENRILPYTDQWGWRGGIHMAAARYSETVRNGEDSTNDGNARYDFLMCPADKRPRTDSSTFATQDSSTVQVFWSNGDTGLPGSHNGVNDYVRLWTSYGTTYSFPTRWGSRPPTSFARLDQRYGLFLDSWRVDVNTDGWNPAGSNRHGRGVNMVFPDGHVARIDVSPMRHGEHWQSVTWPCNVPNSWAGATFIGGIPLFNDLRNEPWGYDRPTGLW